MRTMIIDTDTASDDAVALVMALRAPDVRVAAITIVAGNVPVNQGAINALYTAQLVGVEVPVYKGAPQPLMRPMSHADWFHGRDGMGDMNYPAPLRQPEAEHAVEALIRHIRANPGCLLVTLGPLTNIALAVAQAPDIAGLVERCVVMGGAANTVGNVTPAAEYNIWVDPEAADMVFRSGLPIEMVGWELCRFDAVINNDEMTAIRAFDTPLAHFALDCNRQAIMAAFEQSGEVGMSLPDPVAMAVALDPTICTEKSRHAVIVDTSQGPARGMTIVDRLGVSDTHINREQWAQAQAGNVQVCWAIDIPRWKASLYEALR